MKAPIPAIALVLVTAAATAAVILPSATAEPAAQEATTTPAATAPAPELVTGLPDFTRLVEQVGPGVVSIEAVISMRTAQRGPRSAPPDEIPEIFRRFFGPGFPFGGQPGDPQAPVPRGMSMGTGFLISEDGYLLTNHHVVANAEEVRVRLHDHRQFDAEVVGSDEQSDVAVLKIEADDLTVLRPGDASAVRPGQWAVAIGSPFGLEQSVTAGIVSAVGRANRYSAQQQYVPFIQTDVAINRGNSGGPLLNTRGEVIGINSQIFSNSGGYQGVSFAIPIDIAMNVAEQIKDTGSVQRGLIGVTVGAVTREIMAGFDLPDTRGALVNGIQPGSPAEDAGIEVGDVIRSVDGTAIVRASDLPPIVGNMAPGTRVELEVFREGRTRNFTVTLASLDSATGASQAARPGGRGPAPGAAQSSNPLGLAAQDLTEAQRRQAGLPEGEGVRITAVDGQAARSAGIRPGDVISRVGRSVVGSAADLDRLLRNVQSGQTVMLLRHRGGATEFVAVTLEADD